MPPTPATPGHRIGNRSLIGFFKLYGRAMKPPLARNIAEVIDDLYRQHAPPRDHERLIEMGSSIRSSMRCGWRLRRNGDDATSSIRPRRHLLICQFAAGPVNPGHQWRRRTKVWRRVTSLAQWANRPRTARHGCADRE